jgi:hypothetical protein
LKAAGFHERGSSGPAYRRGFVDRELAIHSNIRTRGSMLSDEALTLGRSCASGIRFGITVGLGADARVISSERLSAAILGKSKSLSAHEICRKTWGLECICGGVELRDSSTA